MTVTVQTIVESEGGCTFSVPKAHYFAPDSKDVSSEDYLRSEGGHILSVPKGRYFVPDSKDVSSEGFGRWYIARTNLVSRLSLYHGSTTSALSLCLGYRRTTRYKSRPIGCVRVSNNMTIVTMSSTGAFSPP